MRSCRGSQPRELVEEEAKARGKSGKRPVGCHAIAREAPRASLLLSPPLQALLLGHPSRTSVDGKWVREGCFFD